jgi:deoxyhypusine synthase
MQADYSVVMPFLAKALLEKRARFERWAERMGREALFRKHPAARGYLRPPQGYQLFERRDELMAKLSDAVKRDADRIARESHYALAAAAPKRAASRKPSPSKSKTADAKNGHKKPARRAKSGAKK